MRSFLLPLFAIALLAGSVGGAIADSQVKDVEFAPPADLILAVDGHTAYDPDVPADLEGHAHIAGDGPSEVEQEKAGLPQLDPYWYPSQAFWLLVSFLFMYALFSRKVLPDLSSTIENRREHIQNDLDTAEKLRDEAETAQQTYEELLKESNQEARDLVVKTDQDVKAKYNKTMDEFRDNASKTLQDTETELEKTKKKVMGEMHEIAAEIASEAAFKIVGIKADVKQVKTVVENIDKKAA